ncbi:hypothetical protein CDAR_6302 [Caerostris darwini]|uniref:MHD2 domain-containing protein n=1 Tax=Caerostris darwini TaxID=1538125 RepID=A0AAV4MM74_9ARAC|nr:hypothetical protein CDAR_6302 [Caerostris darwini]
MDRSEKSATSQLSRNSAAHYRIGSIRENIRDLPCVGRELLWTLRKGPRRLNTRGQLSIFTQLSTKKAPDHKLHIIMQMEMLKLCYEKQLPVLEPDKQWKNWLEILPNAALTLLQQHALQYGLTSTEQCVCSWIVASALKINQEGRISFYFLHTLLEGLISDIYEDPIEPYLEGALGSAIIKFSEYNKSVLGNLHNYFEVQIVEEADELFYLLKSMCSVEMQTYSNFLDSYVVIAGESYAAWTISYSKITFTELDSVINDTIKPMIQHLMLVMRDPDRKRVIKESLQLLQLYHNVRNLVQYVLNDLPTERAVLSMDEYSSWFGDDLILEWFLLCDMFTKPYIKRAVIADSMERLTKDIPHSTSVPDIVSIIDEMVIDVWTKLKWEEQFYTHAALLEAVRTCVLDYVQALYDRMCLEDLLVAAQDLGINEKLCVSMSNLYAVFEHLYTTKNKIKGILRVAESNYGFTIMDPMASIGTQMQIEISAVYLVILEEESTILFYYVAHIFQKFVKKALRGTLDIFLSSSTVIGEACTYIEKILEMLYLNLKAEAFYIVLRHIWIIVITCVKRGLESYQGCYGLFRRKTAFVAALQTLTQLQEIFYCDGHGLSHQELRNPIFEELKHKIEVKLKIQDKTIHQKEYLCV